MRMHDPRVIDARGKLLAIDALGEAHLESTVEVMNAIFRWRQAEQRVSEASQEYMQLSSTDMKAVRYVIVRSDQGEVVTARDVAEHLGISSASTTKLLDRLERGGHIERRPHPHDRRALALSVTERTREAAEATIGHEHARRFRIAASLDEAEREIVVRFLNALADTGEDTWPKSS